jgi:threonine dehydratase
VSLSLESAPTNQARASCGEEALTIINNYRSHVDEHFSVEPLDTEFPTFARELDANVQLARAGDNLAGAFKWRGAIYGAYKLHEQGIERLVVPSAGNHARGAALAARALNMPAMVIVPESAPDEKKHKIKQLWSSSKLRVLTRGETFSESLQFAVENFDQAELLHPYDNPDVMAGQGTIVDDILYQSPDAKHLVVPVGGGGLAGGMLNRLNELGRSDITVHAVEAAGSDSASSSLAAGRLIDAYRPNQLYGGSAVSRIGELAYQAFIDHSNFTVVTSVFDDDVSLLIESYKYDRKEQLIENVSAYEPTSLVAIAGLTRVIDGLKAYDRAGEQVVVIGTGHNAPLQPKSPGHHYPRKSPRNISQ